MEFLSNFWTSSSPAQAQSTAIEDFWRRFCNWPLFKQGVAKDNLLLRSVIKQWRTVYTWQCFVNSRKIRGTKRLDLLAFTVRNAAGKQAHISYQCWR